MIVGMEVVSGYRSSPSGSFAHAPELKARGQGHVILVPSAHPAHNTHVTPAHAQWRQRFTSTQIRCSEHSEGDNTNDMNLRDRE